MAKIKSYFAPGEKYLVAELLETVRDAQEIADTNYGVDEAVEWAEGYEFPKEMLALDLRSFEEAKRDFAVMVGARLETLQSSRLNLERIAGGSISRKPGERTIVRQENLTVKCDLGLAFWPGFLAWIPIPRECDT